MFRTPAFHVVLAAALLWPLQARAQQAAGDAAPSAELIALGAPAPGFTLPDITDGRFSITDHLGKSPIVLSFWSIYCESCVDEMLSLQKLEDKYQGAGLVIVAVNEDIKVPLERIRRFRDRLEKFRGKITYPLLYDEDSQVLEAYGIATLPALVLIDRQGLVAGYSRGFEPEAEFDLLARVEGLVRGDQSAVSGTRGFPAQRSRFIEASGEATLCGFYDSSGWRKSFTGSDSYQQELELTRDIARRAATRNAVSEALSAIGVDLYSIQPRKDCVDGSGIHLSRDPFDTGDPVSNLLALISYSDFFETVEEQEMLIGETYYTTRRVRVYIDALRDELQHQGYLFEPLRITFTYVNMSPLDQREFLNTLLKNSMYVGSFEEPVFTIHSTSQIFEVYTSSQGFADEILDMDFGRIQVFVEEVTPSSLELEVWK